MAVEEQSAGQRNKEPYNRFISMNFMICRDAFLKVRFDETFHLGYEDTLFGMQLEQAGVEILHIDNPVYHLVEENSEQFLMKIRRAVRNLDGHIEQMHSHVKLLRWYACVKRLGMAPLAAFLFRQIEKRLVSNLNDVNARIRTTKSVQFCRLSVRPSVRAVRRVSIRHASIHPLLCPVPPGLLQPVHWFRCARFPGVRSSC